MHNTLSVDKLSAGQLSTGKSFTSAEAPAVADKSLINADSTLCHEGNWVWLKLFKYSLNDFDSTMLGLVHGKLNSATATTGLPLSLSHESS